MAEKAVIMPQGFDVLANVLPIPLLLIGPNERIEIVNAAARALFDTGDVGQHYITALRQPSVLDAVEQVMVDGQTRVSAYLGGDTGRETVWRVTAAAVPLTEGQGVMVSFEDVTAVEEAGQMRRDFVANVSHELRTPLTSLIGFIDTLKGAARDDPVARDRFLDIMAREADRMGRLVQDLLSLRRVEDQERIRPTDQVVLGSMLESVISAFAPAAKAAGSTIHLTQPAEPISIVGDAGQLRQVMNNLIENAIKYGGGTDVDVALTDPVTEPMLRSTGVRISVTDHGEGIAGHHIPRLTERFYRVDTHRSRAVGGTGLGLAIVKHIINRHRGRLRIESEPGQGSTFTAIFPVC